MSTSQNGWTVNPTRDADFAVAGVAFPGGVRAGDVSAVFAALGQRLAQRVEEPIAGQCWGYASRPIRGQTTGYSNHASATAIDWNAPKHPRGKRGTFTKTQVIEIHAILAELNHVFRWGGDYMSGTIDEMHFEINVPAAAVTKLAKQIKGANVMAKLDKDDLAAIRTIVQDEVWGYHRKDAAKDASQLLQDIHDLITDPNSVLGWGYNAKGEKEDAHQLLLNINAAVDELLDRVEEGTDDDDTTD